MNKGDCFIGAADLHIHSKNPENRVGDYYKHVMDKFAYLLKITQDKSEANLLVIGGDFFDSPKVPYKVTIALMEMLIIFETNVLVVPGQHDLRYHVSGLDNTPLGVLEAAGLIRILRPDQYYKYGISVSFVGAGWNEEPEIEADVVVTHRMVTKKGELWPGQTDYSTAAALLRKWPWAKCIISGDNHAPHCLKKDGKLQINCGSMVRSSKAQIDYQPRCWVIDASKWDAKPIKIPCKPAEEVFDFEAITIQEMKEDAKDKAKEKIAAFIDTLPQSEKEKPNFKNILKGIIDSVNPNDNVKDIISKTMERISE